MSSADFVQSPNKQDESVETLKRRLKKAISVAEKLKSKYDFETEVINSPYD